MPSAFSSRPMTSLSLPVTFSVSATSHNIIIYNHDIMFYKIIAPYWSIQTNCKIYTIF